MDLSGAAELLEKLVARLREKGVRSFKGALKDDTGATVWELDLTFDRPAQPAAKESEL